MVDIPGNDTTTATLTVGSTVNDLLEVAGDHDWFRIELTAGQSVTVMLTGGTLNDPYLRIRDANGNLIRENDDTAGTFDSRVSFTAPSTGTYYIDVAAFGSGTGTYEVAVSNYTPPPTWTVDEVVYYLTTGSWTGDTHAFDAGQGDTITVDLTALTAEGQFLAVNALALWSDVTGITFTQVSNDAQITFDDSQDGAFAESSWSDGVIDFSTVNISTEWLADGATIDSYAFQTYIHEIGHALGLGHPGEYNGTADYYLDAQFANDAWPMTVMSYFSQDDSAYFADRGFDFAFVATPMIADIAAMQQLYGLSTTTRTGNTTYGFNSTAGRAVFNADLHTDLAYTIFDSGGIDTLDYSGFSANQLIDLAAGSYSNVGALTGNVAIALGTVIENAIGGTGNDEVRGNTANNILSGGAGDDALFGYEGTDTLYGGGGIDSLTGGIGADTMSGGAGGDAFRGTAAQLNGDIITDFAVGDQIIITDATFAGFTLLGVGLDPDLYGRDADADRRGDGLDCSHRNLRRRRAAHPEQRSAAPAASAPPPRRHRPRRLLRWSARR